MKRPFLNFLTKRLAFSIFLLWGIATITFLLVHVAPGGPEALYSGPRVSPEVLERIRHQFGLDRSLLAQYGHWLWRVLHLDFGFSYTNFRPVAEVLAGAIPNTLLLTGAALAVELGLALLLGIYSAVRAGTRGDLFVNYFSIFLFSIPEFWLALLAIYLFSVKLGWLPAGQMMSVGAAELNVFQRIGDVLRHLVLPAGILSLTSMAYSMRLVRSSLMESLSGEDAEYLHAMGIPKKKIERKYALRGALMPFLTHVGMSLPFLLGGSFIIENVFSWPGMGRLTMAAILSRDYPVILAANLISGALVVLGNLLADLAYALVDPRVRLT